MALLLFSFTRGVLPAKPPRCDDDDDDDEELGCCFFVLRAIDPNPTTNPSVTRAAAPITIVFRFVIVATVLSLCFDVLPL